MKSRALFLSCEHAVNFIPRTYQWYFAQVYDLLNTHRGIDIGALAVAQYFSKTFNCPLVTAQVSRLLIDCNRSLTNRACFSEFTVRLPKNEKKAIIQTYYLPYRQKVETSIRRLIAQGHRVFHLSIHSFTPMHNGTERNAHIGLLYDPKRNGETQFAKAWRQQLIRANKGFKVRLNYPYRGVADGFTRALRKLFSEENYLGLEVEVNQALLDIDNSMILVAEELAKGVYSFFPR